jgi:hypothetical protein
MRVCVAVPLSVVICATAFCASRSAYGQTYCIPSVTGPTHQPGAPDWWATSKPLDDPHWIGALKNSTGSGDSAEFRALAYGSGNLSYIILTLQVRADPGPADTGDVVYFGLSDGLPNGVSNVIRLVRSANTTAPLVGAIPAASDVSIRYADGGTWHEVATKPSWLLNNTRINQTCSGAAPSCSAWAFRVRIPIDSTGTAANPTWGINVPISGFKVWYEVHVDSTDTQGRPYTTRHKLPPTAPDVCCTPETYPDPTTTWTSASLLPSSSCAGGVSLTPSQTDVTYPGAVNGKGISLRSTNTFHARPINRTGKTLSDRSLQARFRIANWASDIGDSPTWETIPGLQCGAATGPGAGDVPDGSSFDLTCTWAPTDLQRCTYRPDLFNDANTPACSPMPASKYPRQCVLVELSMTPGSQAPVFFSTDSSDACFDFNDDITDAGATDAANPDRSDAGADAAEPNDAADVSGPFDVDSDGDVLYDTKNDDPATNDVLVGVDGAIGDAEAGGADARDLGDVNSTGDAGDVGGAAVKDGSNGAAEDGARGGNEPRLEDGASAETGGSTGAPGAGTCACALESKKRPSSRALLVLALAVLAGGARRKGHRGGAAIA